MAQLPSTDWLIDFKKLTVIRGDKAILSDFSLRVQRGEHVVILGPNGSGKSTLIKLMTCDLYPQTGIEGSQFALFGLERWGLEDLRQHLGIVTLDMLQKLSHEVTAREVNARDMVLVRLFQQHRTCGLIIKSPQSRSEEHTKSCVSLKSSIWPPGRFRRCHPANNAGP